MKLIGISGKIGTGKSTLGQHLCHILGDGWIRKAYGDFLKEEVSTMFGFPTGWCYSEDGKNKIIETGILRGAVRELMQWWGTEVRRKNDPDYWVKKMDEWLCTDFLRGEHHSCIIDDVRFPNEAELVHKFGGKLIRVNPYEGWTCEQQFRDHESETALDDWQKWDTRANPDYGGLKALAIALVDNSS